MWSSFLESNPRLRTNRSPCTSTHSVTQLLALLLPLSAPPSLALNSPHTFSSKIVTPDCLSDPSTSVWFCTYKPHRSRSRGRSKRSRSRDRSPKRSRPKSPSPIRDERTKEQKEIDELTKDQRTVFVSQLVRYTARAAESFIHLWAGLFQWSVLVIAVALRGSRKLETLSCQMICGGRPPWHLAVQSSHPRWPRHASVSKR